MVAYDRARFAGVKRSAGTGRVVHLRATQTVGGGAHALINVIGMAVSVRFATAHESGTFKFPCLCVDISSLADFANKTRWS